MNQEFKRQRQTYIFFCKDRVVMKDDGAAISGHLQNIIHGSPLRFFTQPINIFQKKEGRRKLDKSVM